MTDISDDDLQFRDVLFNTYVNKANLNQWNELKFGWVIIINHIVCLSVSLFVSFVCSLLLVSPVSFIIGGVDDLVFYVVSLILFIVAGPASARIAYDSSTMYVEQIANEAARNVGKRG